jgi:hypothetical protein
VELSGELSAVAVLFLLGGGGGELLGDGGSVAGTIERGTEEGGGSDVGASDDCCAADGACVGWGASEGMTTREGDGASCSRLAEAGALLG